MNEKIKAIPWYQWVIIGISGILLSVILLTYSILPWQIALDISTTRAIEIFGSGESTGNYFFTQRAMGLAGILLLFIIGPVLLFSYFLSDEERSDTGEEISPAPLKSFSFWTGMILVVGGLAAVAYSSVKEPVSFQGDIERAGIQMHKDYLYSEIAELALGAAEYLFLRTEFGGGGGSFEQFTIEDLSFYHELEHSRYAGCSVESDTMLVLTVVGSEAGEDESFENMDGSTGNIQIRASVTPSDYIDLQTEN